MLLKQAEVIDLLNNKLGIPCSDRTLLNYEKWGLISAPKRGSGKKGKWTEYTTMSISDAIVAWRLIHGEYDAEGIYELFDGKVPKLTPKIISFAKELGYAAFFDALDEANVSSADELLVFFVKNESKTSKASDEILKKVIGRIHANAHFFVRWALHLWVDEKMRALKEVWGVYQCQNIDSAETEESVLKNIKTSE